MGNKQGRPAANVDPELLKPSGLYPSASYDERALRSLRALRALRTLRVLRMLHVLRMLRALRAACAQPGGQVFDIIRCRVLLEPLAAALLQPTAPRVAVACLELFASEDSLEAGRHARRLPTSTPEALG